ncbi:hypothetical protein [Gymnodinialimonas sp. 57CJ19]|uniref:hypothetical protein n=1 Tax=Gymnodinialimonas sp. 57CJ19 TaxID=3138498 RepID=UPI0031344CD0
MAWFKKQRATREKMLYSEGFPTAERPSYRAVLSALEMQLQAEWYLEIGSRTGTSLADRTCNFIAVDPDFSLGNNVFNKSETQFFFQEESDKFFARDFLSINKIVPELAFVDGMHLIEYILRDFRNAEASMSSDGVIALHDILPFNTRMTTRDLTALDKLDAWTGDVWKIIPILQRWRPDLTLEVIGAFKTGLLVVRNLDPNNRVLFDAETDILGAFQGTELSDYGPKTLFDSFELTAPATYIAAIEG